MKALLWPRVACQEPDKEGEGVRSAPAVRCGQGWSRPLRALPHGSPCSPAQEFCCALLPGQSHPPSPTLGRKLRVHQKSRLYMNSQGRAPGPQASLALHNIGNIPEARNPDASQGPALQQALLQALVRAPPAAAQAGLRHSATWWESRAIVLGKFCTLVRADGFLAGLICLWAELFSRSRWSPDSEAGTLSLHPTSLGQTPPTLLSCSAVDM